MNRGHHIVLEGPDASGKKTQSTLLVERLNTEGYTAERMSFPQYDRPFGKLITEYLEGNSPSTDPAYAAILYAADRASIAENIIDKLNKGTSIVFDRYVASNLAHQVARVTENYTLTPDAMAAWIEKTEYETLAIPRADMTILLNVPFELCLRKAEERKQADKRTAKDIHEEDRLHIQRAWERYQLLAQQNNWPVINCAPQGELLSREEIANQVWQTVTNLIRPNS